MTVKNLINVWSLPDRTQDRQQITLRLNYDLYAKLHALKEVYPSRTVNDMINDILRSGLDEIIEALPTYTVSREEAAEQAHYLGGPIEDYLGLQTGPSVQFKFAYANILKSKSEQDTNSDEAA